MGPSSVITTFRGVRVCDVCVSVASIKVKEGGGGRALNDDSPVNYESRERASAIPREKGRLDVCVYLLGAYVTGGPVT
jgi:hypothetical protein